MSWVLLAKRARGDYRLGEELFRSVFLISRGMKFKGILIEAVVGGGIWLGMDWAEAATCAKGRRWWVQVRGSIESDVHFRELVRSR